MDREFELKYRADDAAISRIREKYGEFTPISKETTYCVTPGGDFGRRHWTLRRRYEDGLSVCTLTTPAPGGGRGEWEVHAQSIEAAVPQLCVSSGLNELEQLTSGGLTVSCGARFTRLAKTIAIPGAVVELALDRGVLLGGGREEPFAEVEAELKEGSEDAVTAFAEALAAEFSLEKEKFSKQARARMLTR